MTPRRKPARIGVYCGTFQSQQLVFAHLLDWADERGAVAELDGIEVIRITDAPARLAHYFSPDAVAEVLRAQDRAKGSDTLVLATDAGALPSCDSSRLSYLGCLDGSLIRARPEGLC